MLKELHAERIIETIAQQKGISTEEVRNEMEIAINAGYANLETKQRWDEIFGRDHKPEPEEFIIKMAGMILSDTI